jgi:hypothetical protein
LYHCAYDSMAAVARTMSCPARLLMMDAIFRRGGYRLVHRPISKSKRYQLPQGAAAVTV